MERLHARLAGRAKGATGFVSQPEPRSFGSVARGRQLTAGNFLFAGFLVEAPGVSLWDLPVPAPRFEQDLHGFLWLDDLVALGDRAARAKAQDWLWGWIARHGRGTGPGWTPDLTGRRIIRWVHHAIFLLHGQDRAASNAFFTVVGRQCIFLSRRWHTASPGLPRIEALTGLVYAGLSLTGLPGWPEAAIAALEAECAREINRSGGLATRNPEHLLEVFTLLTWAAEALTAAGRKVGPEHRAALERMAPTLRTLRHSDGALARFHGGGRGASGRLDQALAATGIRGGARPDTLAMGFARLAASRTSVIVDAAVPPQGAASRDAHASTLAFELTSARRPLIVNCGSGAVFGDTWRRAGRATPSHSTLGIDGVSSSRLAPSGANGGGAEGEILTDPPKDVRVQFTRNSQGINLMVGHDGYGASHGLTHVRKLSLSRDGRSLVGEDTLGALTQADRRVFDTKLTETNMRGVPFSVRFHLHPDVDAEEDMGGTAVSLVLRSGEVWVFRHDGTAQLRLEPSVYLEAGRLKPRGTRQIVLTSRVVDFAVQIGWTLAKAEDTPRVIRDIAADREDDEISA
ncbi:MAG: heparinase II/III family protein [Pseudomonadota bacterium]